MWIYWWVDGVLCYYYGPWRAEDGLFYSSGAASGRVWWVVLGAGEAPTVPSFAWWRLCVFNMLVRCSLSVALVYCCDSKQCCICVTPRILSSAIMSSHVMSYYIIFIFIPSGPRAETNACYFYFFNHVVIHVVLLFSTPEEYCTCSTSSRRRDFTPLV